MTIKSRSEKVFLYRLSVVESEIKKIQETQLRHGEFLASIAATQEVLINRLINHNKLFSGDEIDSDLIEISSLLSNVDVQQLKVINTIESE